MEGDQADPGGISPSDRIIRDKALEYLADGYSPAEVRMRTFATIGVMLARNPEMDLGEALKLAARALDEVLPDRDAELIDAVTEFTVSVLVKVRRAVQGGDTATLARMEAPDLADPALDGLPEAVRAAVARHVRAVVAEAFEGPRAGGEG
jgi:hypothetical protein